MNIDTFWKLIENAQRKDADGWIELDHNALIDTLIPLPIEEIQDFGRIFYRMKAKAYRADLWDAVYLVACGCGDNAFDDFKNWLIVQGQETYDKALGDPDNLADIVPRKHRFDLGDVRLPERDITIANVAEVAYERKTGELLIMDMRKRLYSLGNQYHQFGIPLRTKKFRLNSHVSRKN